MKLLTFCLLIILTVPAFAQDTNAISARAYEGLIAQAFAEENFKTTVRVADGEFYQEDLEKIYFDEEYWQNSLKEARAAALLAYQQHNYFSESNKAESNAINALGESAYQAKDYQLAVDTFTKATQVNPFNAQAYSNLGLAYQRLGKLDDAINANGKAIVLARFAALYADITDTTNVRIALIERERIITAAACYNIARIYEAKKEYRKALWHYLSALSWRNEKPHEDATARICSMLGAKRIAKEIGYLIEMSGVYDEDDYFYHYPYVQELGVLVEQFLKMQGSLNITPSYLEVVSSADRRLRLYRYAIQSQGHIVSRIGWLQYINSDGTIDAGQGNGDVREITKLEDDIYVLEGFYWMAAGVTYPSFQVVKFEANKLLPLKAFNGQAFMSLEVCYGTIVCTVQDVTSNFTNKPYTITIEYGKEADWDDDTHTFKKTFIETLTFKDEAFYGNYDFFADDSE